MNALITIKTFVFDLDGTLVRSIPYESVLHFVASFSDQTFNALFERYQKEWHGLEEAQRYHESIVPIKSAHLVTQQYEQFIRAKSEPEVIDGVIELLDLLRRNARRIICWTRGDRERQLTVLRTSGLEALFDDVVITGAKNPESVSSKLLPVIQDDSFVMIGDSYEQDIAPLLGLAEYCYWITGSEANSFLQTLPQPASRVIALQSISDLLPLIQA